MSEIDDMDEKDDKLDAAMQAAWETLESGDVPAARAAAAATLATWPSASPEIMMLEAACDREEGDFETALVRLKSAAKSDPEWATPELWIAEILSETENRQGEALEHAARAVDLAEDEDEFLAALGCKAAIELELGRPAQARKTLQALPSADVPLEDPVVALEFVHLLMEAEVPGEARARLGVLTEKYPDYGDAWYLRGVLADMEGDEAVRTEAWVKTRELDVAELDDGGHAHHGDCVHLNESQLVQVGEETLAEIPAELRGRLAGVPIIVADLPASGDVETGVDPRALGLFHGATDAERGVAPALTEILLFRKNIERVAHDEESVRDEVKTTLLHEAGHFFGLDEEALERLGI